MAKSEGEIRRKVGRAAYAAGVRAQRVEQASRAAVLFEARPARAETMSEVFAAYLADLERLKKPSAIEVRSAIGCWLAPALGHLAPADCTPSRIAGLVRVMTEAGLAANTIRTKCGFVRAALGCAVRLEHGAPPVVPADNAARSFSRA
jgi:hypothetical protein